jgi:hypothetical protein
LNFMVLDPTGNRKGKELDLVEKREYVSVEKK